MSMQITAAGNSFAVLPQGLPQESLRRMPAFQTEQQAAARESFRFSVPGSRKEPAKNPDIDSATSDLEKVSLAFNKKLKFVIDHESNEVSVKVIDSETDKVIKVLPPEELQRLHRRLKDTLGFLFDERV